MRKRWLTYLLIALVCMACGEEQGDRALVQGTIKGLVDDTLIVYGADQMFDRVDTIYVRKGKFKRFIAVDTLAQAWIMYKDGQKVPLFLDKRSNIKIKGDTAQLLRLQIEDQGENHLLTQFNNEFDTTLTIALVDTFITRYPTSTVGFYLMNRYLQDASKEERQLVVPLMQKIDEEIKHHPQYKAIDDRLKAEAKTDSGTSVNYFRLKNQEEKWVSRTDFSRKWLIINFWASWNETSKQQNRTLYKPLYKEIKKEKIDDLAMWGISLDIDRKVWKEAIQKDTLEWAQGCDAKGWLTEAAKMFDIRYLPANVLITPDGKISAINLTKEQLEEKVKELKEKKKEKEKKK